MQPRKVYILFLVLGIPTWTFIYHWGRSKVSKVYEYTKLHRQILADIFLTPNRPKDINQNKAKPSFTLRIPIPTSFAIELLR